MSTNFKREGVKEHTLTPTMSRFCTCSSFRPPAGFFLRLAFIACIFIWSNTGGSQNEGEGDGRLKGAGAEGSENLQIYFLLLIF